MSPRDLEIAAQADGHGPDPGALRGALRSVAVAPPRSGFWRRLRTFVGPGWLVAVGYMDPGNWATDLAAGSLYGYGLLGVVCLASLLAMFLQTLALRLGIATGLDLAQACRRRYPRPVTLGLWLSAEIAIVACNVAEVLGAAVALKLLFGIPLLAGAALTALDVILILELQKRGFRFLEAVLGALVATIAGCFAIELALARPSIGALAAGLLPPTRLLADPQALTIAIGILGATVMPHNLYLHSAIAQTRRFALTSDGRHEAVRFATIDCVIALTIAMLINAAILVLAAAAFHAGGQGAVAGLEEAHALLAPVLGTGLASVVFAIALLASGQSASVTGILAGQIVGQGFVHWTLPPVARLGVTRALAIGPVLLVLALAGEDAVPGLLVLSQVVLSLQLAFAVIPLVACTSDPTWMGALVSPPWMRLAGWAAAALVVGLNLWLVAGTLAGA